MSSINANEVNANLQSENTVQQVTDNLSLDEVQKMEQELAKREQELLQEQIAINEKWKKFR